MNKVEQNELQDIKNVVHGKFNNLIDLGRQIGFQLQLNKFKCLMDTPYENYKYVTNSDLKPIRQTHSDSNSTESIKGFVAGIFKHYDVNPSKYGYNEKIVNTYVYENLNVVSQLKGLHRANENGVNPELYNKILEIINNIRHGAEIQSEEKTIYITGVRGSGKTAFFNYFTSRYEIELNSLNIITVRINVMRTLPAVTIENAIKFKLCRILFTYYCSWETDIERLKNRIKKNYIDAILEKFIKNVDFSQALLDSCHTYFCNYNSKELTSIPSEYSEICEHLLRIISKQYKFIIMLDNFDQLSPNERNKNEYKIRKEQLENIKSSLIFNHSVFLIAVRYSTFRGLQFMGKKKPDCWTIGSPRTYDIIKKRVGFLIDRSSSSDEEKKQKKEYLIKCIETIGTNFLQDETKLSFEEACNVIDSIYSENKRAVINIIRRFIEANNQVDTSTLSPDNYLIRNNYKFFETLPIDTDTGYCKLYFKYLLMNGDILSFGNINSSSHQDNNFIPNLFRFPSVAGSSDMMFSPFLKIRILQLLKNYEEDVTTVRLITILNNIFSYRRDAIKLATIELREDQSIMFKNEKLEESEDNDKFIDNIPIEISSRGKRFLEILPTNVNILAVCLEHIYFPKNLLKQGMPIGNYYEESSNYIIRNIFCSLPKVIGLLSRIEKYEQQKFHEKLSSQKYKYEQYFNSTVDFKFIEQLEDLANKSIEKIFDTHFVNPAGYENERESIYKARRNELLFQLNKVTNG